MTKFQLFVSHSQLSIFDPSLQKPFNNWTRAHVNQGFAWRPGSVSFRTLLESGNCDVELFSDGIEVPVLSSAIRVIEVPFFLTKLGRVEVASVSDGRQFEMASGFYRLRFEALSGVAIRLVFAKGGERQFIILRADPELVPAYPLL